MVKDVQMLTPIIVTTTAFIAIGSSLLISDAGAEWIHPVWVVIGVSLLVDMHHDDLRKKVLRLVTKISAIIAGLCIGVCCGMLVRGLQCWNSPRWTILVLRLLVECLLLLGSSILAQRTQKVSPYELALVCISSSLALFCPRDSLAIARVVAMLYACLFTLAVLFVFCVVHAFFAQKNRFEKTQIKLADSLVTLCGKVLRGADSDKEEVERLSADIRGIGEGVSGTVMTHVRPLVFECYSLYWSSVSGAVTPFIHQHSVSLFCGTQDQFDRYFRASLERIEDGLDGLRNDLLAWMTMNDEKTKIDEFMNLQMKIVDVWIAGHIVEGFQGMEFNFTLTSKTAVFSSLGQRWHMATYLVNLGTMITSLIGFVQYLMPQEKCLIDALNRISAIQKMGSLADLLHLSAPFHVASRGVSSAAISPIFSARHSVDH
jgi:hypothetical protein